ncbi:hypothetical protein N0V82_008131 [Gnomoniopsis sp. IMI 355080]|nr:hypothetical protein N0V82_008131 [Gnomoniopsis sp. IMI 355080]
MVDTAGMSPDDAAAARAAEQARIRKERREAKIKAGGSARLNKITGLGGGLQRDPIPSPQPSTTSSPAATPPQPSSTAAPEQQQQQQQTHHADPDEVDISNSEHYYAPQTTNRVPTADLNDAQLRQMMLGFDPTSSTASNGAAPPNNPFAAMMASMGADPNNPSSGGGGPDPDDPMMKMLSQMMGGAGGPPGAGGAQNPFAAMMGGGGGGPQQQQQQSPPDATAAAIWRVLHFLVAAGLGLYIALLTQFTGTKVARERGAFAAYTTTTTTTGEQQASEEDVRRYFFWAFATAESVLLTSRFFLDKGARGPSGIVATVLGFVPESKWKSLVVNGLQYVQIFSTVRMDLLVCVFVLGICSLVQG